mmetsp:Transcript_36020/g.57838  ORF Transcript_36020/g.57838 Transcript_36020/m.57838 type:complete len:226 (-) Transcript_36020:1294-1971(-)
MCREILDRLHPLIHRCSINHFSPSLLLKVFCVLLRSTAIPAAILRKKRFFAVITSTIVEARQTHLSYNRLRLGFEFLCRLWARTLYHSREDTMRVFQQLSSRSELGHLSRVHNQYLVVIDDSREPVGDRDDRGALKLIAHDFLDLIVGVNVDICRRLVHHDNPSMPNHCSPEANELTFPGAKEGAAGAHLGVEEGCGQSNVDKNVAELIIGELREGIEVMSNRAL